MLNLPDPETIIEKISDINHIYPEYVTIHRFEKEPCSDCFDPVNNEPTDPHCSTCGGDGYVIAKDNSVEIPASVITPEEEVKHTRVGTYFSGDYIITIDKKEIDEYDINIEDIEYFTYKEDKYILDGFQYGSLNGIIYEVKCMVVRKS